MKLSILYFSKTGNTRRMAEAVAAGMKEEVPQAEVRLFNLDEVDEQFIAESAAVVFGTPTYLANTCWQLKRWLDESKAPLGGKLGAVFATANFLQGGADTAILTIVNHLLVKGMLVYSGGASQGQPFIHLGAVALRDGMEEGERLCAIFGRRIAKKAFELFGK